METVINDNAKTFDAVEGGSVIVSVSQFLLVGFDRERHTISATRDDGAVTFAWEGGSFVVGIAGGG